MLVRRQWADEPELLDAVAEALDEAPAGEPIVSLDANLEQDTYGARGHIQVRTKDGRTFYLELWEAVS